MSNLHTATNEAILNDKNFILDEKTVDEMLAEIRIRRKGHEKLTGPQVEIDRDPQVEIDRELLRMQRQIESERRHQILKNGDWNNDVGWEMRKLFCLTNGITNYNINEDGTVDVDENVYLMGSGLHSDRLPIQFGVVTGNFDIRYFENLTTLQGFPRRVDGDFYISAVGNGNEGAASDTGGNDDDIREAKASDYESTIKWQLETLDGCPEYIGGTFKVHKCPNLKSFSGGPKFVGKQIIIAGCPNLDLSAVFKVKGITAPTPVDCWDSYTMSKLIKKFYKPDGSGGFHAGVIPLDQTQLELQKDLFENADWSNDVDWKWRKLFCLREGIQHYTIRDDGTVDVDGDVHISGSSFNINWLPFQFGEVSGYFGIKDLDGMVTLKGCPRTVGGDFDIGDLRINSLEGGPEVVLGHYGIRSCLNLTHLIGRPSFVGKSFKISHGDNLQILPMFKIRGMTSEPPLRSFDSKVVQEIFRKYYKPDGTGDDLAARDELIDAGFSAIACLPVS